MKPLLHNIVSELLTRIDNAIDGELYAVTMNSPVNFTIELSVQDRNRGHDWINIAFKIDGISDARLIEDEQLSLVDMSDGMSIVFEDGACALGIGDYRSIESMKSSVLYVTGSSIKYEERPFKN
ncbi:MAG: hypothetical protein PF439_00545 [Helicobacteraceae bacterium]|jgi:hypothetical protein|nr:hypothetical protein [Helicobacteraceae bacterium]